MNMSIEFLMIYLFKTIENIEDYRFIHKPVVDVVLLIVFVVVSMRDISYRVFDQHSVLTACFMQ